MVLNYIWVGFLLAAFVVAIFRVVGYLYRDFFLHHLGWVFDTQDMQVFSKMVDSTWAMAETSVNISIYLIGVMTLWLGIMKIGENGGAVGVLSRMVSPFFTRIFPEIPRNHPAMGSILMNFCANMLGLDNAATPLGLKAMKELQELNPTKATASNAQIMFIVLNTSALTLVPIGIMGLRAASHAANPTDVFLPLILTTFFSTLVGLIAVSIYQRINLFQPVLLAYLAGVTAIIGLILSTILYSPQERVSFITNFSGNFILFLFIIFFVALGILNRINVYESFVEGAKDGFKVAVSIIPYLLAMLFAIGIFRASGAMDFIVSGIGELLAVFGLNTDFVPALPVAFMKPLSGSGARGLMVEAMNTYGVDSFVGRLASIFQGSTETTFYTLVVYYGAVKIKNTRYTVTCGLLADLAGAIAAICMGYIFFG